MKLSNSHPYLKESIQIPQSEIDELENSYGGGDIDLAFQNMKLHIATLEAELAEKDELIKGHKQWQREYKDSWNDALDKLAEVRGERDRLKEELRTQTAAMEAHGKVLRRVSEELEQALASQK